MMAINADASNIKMTGSLLIWFQKPVPTNTRTRTTQSRIHDDMRCNLYYYDVLYYTRVSLSINYFLVQHVSKYNVQFVVNSWAICVRIVERKYFGQCAHASHTVYCCLVRSGTQNDSEIETCTGRNLKK